MKKRSSLTIELRPQLGLAAGYDGRISLDGSGIRLTLVRPLPELMSPPATLPNDARHGTL